MSDISETLADAFAEHTDEETAQDAAGKIGDFAAEYDEDLTADAVLDLLDDAPYDEFGHQFDWVVGELAANHDDCTDSRPFRLDGFGDLAADPEQGA